MQIIAIMDGQLASDLFCDDVRGLLGIPIALASWQSNVSGFFFGIRCSLIATLAPLARNDTWNLYFVMLSVAKHLFAIALDSKLPATARNVYVRAEGIT